MLVETDAALRDFMARCAKSPYMAIDTEFLREKTYYAKLCLVQIAIEGEVAIIDPLGIRDLSVMAPALSDPNIMKIFHASSLALFLRQCSIRKLLLRCWEKPSKRRMLRWSILSVGLLCRKRIRLPIGREDRFPTRRWNTLQTM